MFVEWYTHIFCLLTEILDDIKTRQWGRGFEEIFFILKESSLWSSPRLNLSVGGWHTQRKRYFTRKNDTESELPQKIQLCLSYFYCPHMQFAGRRCFQSCMSASLATGRWVPHVTIICATLRHHMGTPGPHSPYHTGTSPPTTWTCSNLSTRDHPFPHKPVQAHTSIGKRAHTYSSSTEKLSWVLLIRLIRWISLT